MLGMHRSGTSATTRAINLLGVPTCLDSDYMPGLEGNPRGHYESTTLVEINTRLLAEHGRFWWCPPPVGTFDAGSTSVGAEAAREAFVAVHPTAQWVSKDPRTCITLPFWMRVLPERPVAVIVNRNPLEIAASLEKRNEFPKELTLALWERHLRSALTSARGLPVFLTHYDELLSDPETWCANAAGFLTSVGVDLDPDRAPAIAGSLEKGLRHSRYSLRALREDPAVSPAQVELYSRLCECAGATAEFEPPDLPEEDPSVEARLRAFNRKPRRVVRRIRRNLRASARRLGMGFEAARAS